jgi:hypothetical protein
LAALATSPGATQAQPGTVISNQKISDAHGGFTGVLDNYDRWGVHIAPLAHFDDDPVVDIAVGSDRDDDGGANRGAVWLMFLNSDGTVKGHQKISSTDGNFDGALDNDDEFSRVASLGDLDDDGVTDLAVGAPGDDDGGPNRGAVWILFLNSDGTVNRHRKISDTEGSFSGFLEDNDRLGHSVTTLRDLDDDGNPELAVGAVRDDDGGVDRGAVWVLFLDGGGNVKTHQKISTFAGGFTGILDNSDEFGHAVAPLGDLDQDGVWDLAVGAYGDDDGGENRGAVWILFLNRDGTVKEHRKISDTAGGFAGPLVNSVRFSQVMSLPDIDGDHVQDLAVGAHKDNDGAFAAGAVWILFLNRDGTVRDHQKISSTTGGFTGTLDTVDWFGWSGVFVGDLGGDGRPDLAVSALLDDDGGVLARDRGAVWVLSLDGAVLTAAPDVASSLAISLASRPNPFGGRAVLQYALPNAAAVRLSIVDARGRRVATLVNREQGAGPHSAIWSGRDDAGVPAGAGIYFARLEAADKTAVRKIVLVK